MTGIAPIDPIPELRDAAAAVADTVAEEAVSDANLKGCCSGDVNVEATSAGRDNPGAERLPTGFLEMLEKKFKEMGQSWKKKKSHFEHILLKFIHAEKSDVDVVADDLGEALQLIRRGIKTAAKGEKSVEEHFDAIANRIGIALLLIGPSKAAQGANAVKEHFDAAANRIDNALELLRQSKVAANSRLTSFAPADVNFLLSNVGTLPLS